MKSIILIVAIFGLTNCAGLSTAFMVKQTKDGGKIRLNGTSSIMEEGSTKVAKRMMASHCKGKYDIIESGVEIIPIANYAPTMGMTHKKEKYFNFKCTK